MVSPERAITTMRFALATFFFLFLILYSPAFAGAWLREKGTGFTSSTASATLSRDLGQTTYLEHGVRDDVTLGAELSFHTAASGLQSGFASFFVRRPLVKQRWPHVWAYELGMGVRWTGNLVLPNLKAGISWGRGYSLNEIDGWMAIDTSVLWDLYNSEYLAKIDGTLGMNFTPRLTGMLQLFYSGWTRADATYFAPSIVFRPVKARPHVRLQVGAETLIGEPTSVTLKFSLWRNF
tara:strand:- start:39 stop:746 length:708 start_codon:yes stop_codon:yes gene_type:complete